MNGEITDDSLEENTTEGTERCCFEKMRQDHSNLVKRGMALQIAKGRHVHRVPVGYRRVWQDEEFVIEPDPVQAVHVHQAFLIAADGNTSVRELLKIMTGQGLKNANGKPMSASGFHSMLTSPFYTGTVRSGANVAKGEHAPIVSRATFERVQRQLASKRRHLRETGQGDAMQKGICSVAGEVAILHRGEGK